MAVPDFLGIGAQKAGTSWLAANLGKHPEIWIPPLPAIHYFDEVEVSPGVEFPGLFDLKLPYANTRFLKVNELVKSRWSEVMANGELAKWYLKWLFRQRTDEWYFSLFDFPHQAKIAGEITPAYSTLSERTVEAAKRMNPEMKIIFSMRNPIYRCWSQVAMEFNRFRPVALAQASDDEILNFIASREVLCRNDYAGIVRRWKKIFDDDHFYLFFFEEIAGDPGALMNDICRFLGVSAMPEHLAGGFRTRVNEGTYTEFPLAFKRRIAELTIGFIRDCADTFGGHCTAWLEEAEAILS